MIYNILISYNIDYHDVILMYYFLSETIENKDKIKNVS